MPVTTPPSITALPAPPDPNDRATFNARAYPWSAALGTFTTEVEALAENVADNATDAATSATTASTARNEALLAQAAAEAASAAEKWVSGTTYAQGDVVWSPVDFASYRRKTAGAGTTDPSADATNWQALAGSGSGLLRSARTSNTILGTADKGKLIDITSGTFTQTFSACATLADGWWCYIRNSGTGDITLDPNASETIDGLPSFVMYPNEVRLIQCDGTALRSVVLSAFYKAFTASGTFTRPPGYACFGGRLWGGGSSGARSASSGVAVFGGAGGGCGEFAIPASLVGSTETVTVGAGGAAYVGSDAGGGNGGGNSSFGGFLTAYKGNTNATGGSIVQSLVSTTSASPVGYEGGAKNAATTANLSGVWGGGASSNAVDSGNSVFGGAAGGSITAANAILLPGVSLMGGSGGAANTATNGVAGTVPGGGGGATQTGTSAGAGARGEVRIWGVV